MYCPRCNSQLREIRRDGIAIDVCVSCRGVWLDAGELENLIFNSVPHQEHYSPPAPHQPYPPQQHTPNYSDHYHKQEYKDKYYYDKHHKHKKHPITKIFGELFD